MIVKKIYKKIAFFLVLTLLLPSFPLCFAQKGTISQKEAIEKVKKIFDTASYDKFNINYEEQRDGKVWQLHWSRSKKPYNNLDVVVDEKGNILNIINYIEHQPKTPLIPSLSESKALDKAQKFIKKIQPVEFAKTEYVQNTDKPAYLSQNHYVFEFIRLENNIPVEHNGFNITIDANTGEVRNYKFNWHYEGLPSVDNILSLKDAENIFQELNPLKLIYKKFFHKNREKKNIKLIYTLMNPDEILIDAKTGKLIKKDYRYREAARDQGTKESFTPEEQKQIEVTKNCIDKDAAIKIIKKYVKIPKNYTLVQANLLETRENPEEKVWNILWENKSSDKYRSVYGKVNAITSKLLSFRIYDSEFYEKDFKQNYDRKMALKKAEEFIKKIEPEKFKNIKLADTDSQIIPLNSSSENKREHFFKFIRKVDGISYLENGFDISVDAKSGEIISYNVNWDNVPFPKADNIISKKEAFQRFLEDVGLTLNYILVDDPDENKIKSFLVYRPKEPVSLDFDAENFNPLDYQGNFIEEKPKTVFTDISGHWAENDIKLLVSLNIVTSSSNKFYPDEMITEGEFVKLLMLAKGHKIFDIDEDTYESQEYINLATEIGLIKKDKIKADNSLNREKMAVLLVRFLGLDKIAAVPKIFNVPAKDSNAVTPQYKGHVSISLGLKLLSCFEGNFNPKQKVTRAQAVVSIVRLLKVKI